MHFQILELFTLTINTFFSTVLLVFVDAEYNFTAIDICWYRKDSNRGPFAKSNLGEALENKTINIQEDVELLGTNEKLPYVIVWDDAHFLNP
jgi:hypothetical protein